MNISQLRSCRLGLVVTAATFIGMLLPPGAAHGQDGLSGRLHLIGQMDRDGDYATALEILRAAYQRNQDDFDLRYWLAEILVDSSEISAGSGLQEEAKLLCEEAVTHARAAVNVRPRGADGWFQVGRALGALSQLAAGSQSARMARESRAAFEKAISLDPSHAAALHGLARWHRFVASLSTAEKAAVKLFFGGLPPASNEEAVLLFRRAIAIDPATIVHHLELGKTYVELGQAGMARAQFEIVLELPETDHWDVGRKEEARRLLESMTVKRSP